MFFANISIFEFLFAFGAVAALITAIYLAGQKYPAKVVSTLRFWPAAAQTSRRKRRLRIAQPWSLLLQLLTVLLLLGAIGDLTLGRKSPPRSHVVLVDTSFAARKALPEEQELAKQYLDRLPPEDRVMLVAASGTTIARTVLTADRDVLHRALEGLKTDYTALSAAHAIQFADTALKASGGQGDIAYVGPQRTGSDETAWTKNLRLLPVTTQSAGAAITAFTAQAGNGAGEWLATVEVQNFAAMPQTVELRMRFGASEFSPRVLRVQGSATARANFRFQAAGSGVLEASLDGAHAAQLQLPQNQFPEVAVFTRRPAALHALLGTNPRLKTRYFAPSAYRPTVSADLVVLDEFAPAQRPHAPQLWINPPAENSPLPVTSAVNGERIESWSTDPDLARGLVSHDVRVSGNAFELFAGDIAAASTVRGPVAVLRPEESSVMLGFDPLAPSLANQVAVPVLIANLMRAIRPNAFAPGAVSCARAGLISVPFAATRVADRNGRAIPFTTRDGQTQLFVADPAQITVTAPNRSEQISIGLPEPAPAHWTPAGPVATGLPDRISFGAGRELWRILALCAALTAATEWLLYGRDSSRAARFVKWAAIATMLVALVVPAVRIPFRRTSSIVLVDAAAQRSHALAAELASRRHKSRIQVVPFRAIDGIEQALNRGVASAPDGYSPRLLLVSDGGDGTGSAARGLATLQREGLAADTISTAPGGMDVKSVSAPRQTFAGEEIPVNVLLTSARELTGTLTFYAGTAELGSQAVTLHRGDNAIRTRVRVKTPGTTLLTGKFDGRTLFDFPLDVERARVLYISEDLAGAGENLLAALRAQGFEITTDETLLGQGLPGIQLLILNNLDTKRFADEEKQNVADYVSRGGGLLLIGGEHQKYKEDKNLDALDAVLPAKLAPPRNPEGIAVALIIDKSSSMEGRKIDLARLSAIGVVDHLKETDTVGVLIFDNSYRWAVPMRKANDKVAIDHLISGIEADGGTQIPPALAEAYRRLLKARSTYRHIVLLTDGISEEGDSFDLAKEAWEHKVTISTIGLGNDVNRAYLERIARISGGRSYFLDRPQGLQQILLKDVEDYSGSTAVENPFLPVIDERPALLDGVDMEHAPPLKGFARYDAQPGAETILSVYEPDGSGKKNPLLVRWQYGLGRAAIFTSDAKSRWAEAWMNWAGFDKFWTNVARDLLPRSQVSEATASFDAANERLQIEYKIAGPAVKPPMFVLGPNGFSRRVTLEETLPGTFQAKVTTGDSPGLYRIRPLQESTLFPEVAAYRQAPGVTANENLLREIANATGGRFNPDPATVFDIAAKPIYVKVRLWPGVLAAAIALCVAELVLRKRLLRRRS